MSLQECDGGTLLIIKHSLSPTSCSFQAVHKNLCPSMKFSCLRHYLSFFLPIFNHQQMIVLDNAFCHTANRRQLMPHLLHHKQMTALATLLLLHHEQKAASDAPLLLHYEQKEVWNHHFCCAANRRLLQKKRVSQYTVHSQEGPLCNFSTQPWTWTSA